MSLGYVFGFGICVIGALILEAQLRLWVHDPGDHPLRVVYRVAQVGCAIAAIVLLSYPVLFSAR